MTFFCPRAKVHAQRKFAQGVATIFSPVPALVKEKERPKSSVVTELITHKRPNTEDFLTFLCFRGTSILPPSLNFFNHRSEKEKTDPKTARRSNPNSSTQRSASTAPAKPENDPKTDKTLPSKPSPPVLDQPATKKKFSTVIHKPVTTNKFKTATSTVQALKKKYKEQRLAKQRIENKLKTTVMRTRSSASRPLLKPSNKLLPNVFLKHLEKKSLCLRSSGSVPERSALSKSKILPKTKKKPLKKKEEKEDLSSGESSDTQSTPKKSIKPKAIVKQPLKDKLKGTSGKNKADSGRRVTRSHREPPAPAQMNQRPSRKTKEAAAVYMEILSRKLVSPELDNEDNMSLVSFPEIPNARRDSAARKAIEKKKSPVKKSNDDDKPGIQKAGLRAKRNLKTASKYSDSEDNYSMQSERSNQTSVKTRAITRRITKSPAKSGIRNLRSTAKPDQKFDKSNVSVKSSVKEKKKVKVKRKSDDEGSSITKEGGKTSVEKTKKLLKKKSGGSQTGESDEEPLGTLLNRMNNAKPKSPVKRSKPEVKKFPPEPVIMIKKMTKIATVSVKGSDDEGSFRGFSKRSVKNVSNHCSLKMNNDAPKSEKPEVETDAKDGKDCDEKPMVISMVITEEKSSKNESDEPGGSAPVPSIDLPSNNPFPVLNPSLPVAVPPLSTPEKRSFIDVPTLQSMGRKERVNMSTEQIEKWLNDSSMVKEESKAEMETVINYQFGIDGDKTKLNPPVPAKVPVPTVSHVPSTCHLSIPTRIQHLVRPVNVAIAKIAEKQLNTIDLSNHTFPHLKPDIILSSTGIATAKCLSTNRSKINADIKEIIKGRVNSANQEKTSVPVPDTDNESDLNSLKVVSDNETVTTPSPNEKKKNQVQQGRKPFVSKVKERKLSIPNSNAFSPEDESSVYAFKNETEAPVNTPFRRKIRDSSETPKKSDKSLESPNKTEPSTDKSNILPFKGTPSIWNNDCSTSIAVQINFNDASDSGNPFYPLQSRQDFGCDKLKINESTSNEISTQTENSNSNEDSNSTTQVFYIPLENVGRNISHLTNLQGQSLIQGVAVKLGTEGPNGPNQRVLLRAQLVTKPPLSVTRCPPIGTVQPTTRAPQDSIPSTSSSLSTPKTERSTSPSSTKTPEKVKKPTKPVPRAKKPESKPKVVEKKQGKGWKKPSTSSAEPPASDAQSSSSSAPEPSEARLADAPTFHPTEKDFQDPLEYIEKIRPLAEKYGICKVVPPANFKPECKISDDMRFTAYNQYVHRMLHRWGPNVKEMMAIKKYLATQSITLSQPPWIGGMEVDLPHLYQTVQSLGGLKEVIEKKKWQKVADGMKIPKSAQDRVCIIL